MTNLNQDLQSDIDDIYLKVIDAILTKQPNFAKFVLPYFKKALNKNEHNTKKIFIEQLKTISNLPDFLNDNTMRENITRILQDIEDNCTGLKEYLTYSQRRTVLDFITKLEDMIEKVTPPSGNTIPKNIKTGVDNNSEVLYDFDFVDPEDPEALEQSIDNYITLKQLPSAIDRIRKLLAVYAEGNGDIEKKRRLLIMLCILLSKVALYETEIQKKLDLLNEATAIMESFTDFSATELYQIALCFSYKAEVLVQVGKFKKAHLLNIIALNRINDLKSSEAVVKLKKDLNKKIIDVELQTAKSLYDSKQYESALKWFNSLLDLNQQSIDADSCYHYMAKCHLQLGLALIAENKYSEGMINFESVIECYKAIKTSSSSIEADKDNCLQTICEVAIWLYDSKQYEAAINLFEFLLSLNQQSIDADSCYHYMAKCHLQLGLALIAENKYTEGMINFESVIECYKAIKTSSTSIEADKDNCLQTIREVSISLYNSKQYEAAINLFEFLLSLNQQSIDADSCYHYMAKCHLQLGLALIKENKYLDGIEHLKSVNKCYNAIKTSNSSIEADKDYCLQTMREVLNKKNQDSLFASKNNSSFVVNNAQKGQDHTPGL